MAKLDQKMSSLDQSLNDLKNRPSVTIINSNNNNNSNSNSNTNSNDAKSSGGTNIQGDGNNVAGGNQQNTTTIDKSSGAKETRGVGAFIKDHVWPVVGILVALVAAIILAVATLHTTPEGEGYLKAQTSGAPATGPGGPPTSRKPAHHQQP